MPNLKRDGASFRDNRGFIYFEDDHVFRQVNFVGQLAYELLMSSGLYDALTTKNLLIPHKEVKVPSRVTNAYKILSPLEIPFISYPYEWSFLQLKDAALTTLKIQKIALHSGMTLRDASAYNIQFYNGKPIFIDSLSFDKYEPNEPWIAYKQYCMHFLAPLALMSKVDLGMSQLLKVYLDGIPLALAASILPLKSRFNFGLATHIGLHAKFQQQHEDSVTPKKAVLSSNSLLGLIDNLERLIKSLNLPKVSTQWGDYYENTNYSDEAFQEKGKIVAKYLKTINPERVLDLGANDGSFSRIASSLGAYVISADIDPLAVESSYTNLKLTPDAKILPLLVDLTNPSPALGWNNHERASFSSRSHCDAVMALALVHHLAITNNIPLAFIAEYLSSIAPHLIIEFVPKEDSKVKVLLATREDIFMNYTVSAFEHDFGMYYDLVSKHSVSQSTRTIYHFLRKSQP